RRTPPTTVPAAGAANGDSITKGAFIWFNGVLNVQGPHPADFSVRCDGSTMDFVAGGEQYALDVPSASVTFSSSTTMATTESDPASNEWKTVVPSSARAGKAFLAGLGFQAPVDFPGAGEHTDELRSAAPGATPGGRRRRAGAAGVERAAAHPA